MARKFSRKREAILNAIQSTDIHPSAEWVYENVRSDYPDLSLGTVYRNISMFRDEGRISSVGTVNGQERFDGITEPHAHFICDKCGRIFDVVLADMDEQMDSTISSEYNVRVLRHELTFRGLCTDCARQER